GHVPAQVVGLDDGVERSAGHRGCGLRDLGRALLETPVQGAESEARTRHEVFGHSGRSEQLVEHRTRRYATYGLLATRGPPLGGPLDRHVVRDAMRRLCILGTAVPSFYRLSALVIRVSATSGITPAPPRLFQNRVICVTRWEARRLETPTALDNDVPPKPY